MRWLALVALLACPACATVIRVGDTELAPETLLPFAPPHSYSLWWSEMVALSGRAQPAVPFAKLEWWTAPRLQCTRGSAATCEAHAVFLGPKDVIFVAGQETSECWVKHEMAHAILGRGDDAHGDNLFAHVKQSCK